MKYFTPELYRRLQDFHEEAMDAADAAWEQASRRYRRYLQRIWPDLPDSLRQLLETFYLHDAAVLSLGQQEAAFVIVLRLEVPPKELLVLHYQLIEEAVIDKHALPTANSSGPVQWMYDEVARVRGERPSYTHTILLSNGWEIRLRLRDLQVVRAHAVYPETMLVPVPDAVPRSA